MGRGAEERAEIARILSAEVFLCWDCRTASFKVAAGERRRPVVEVFHLPTCPAYERSGWSARACEDYVRAVLIMGGLHLSDYCDGSVAHRKVWAPA